MLKSPPTSEHTLFVDDDDDGDDHHSVNASRPFHGLVLCCTSIEADHRSEIARITADMGGIHKYDLTPDVTHLIVGDYNTAKYRHVAKERPDIKPMAAGWVNAVRTLWVEDREIDFADLEHRFTLKTFESGGGVPRNLDLSHYERQRLICCLTGFEDNNVRAMIEDKVTQNGGEYVADLSRRVTHLIVSKPEGKKYSAARRWEIRCVSIEWLHDSVERGMILDEACYDPTLSPEERGVGAWSRRDLRRSLGKRVRDDSDASLQDGRRKLRKSASMRMNSQNNNLWGDILNQSAGDLSRDDDRHRDSSTPAAPSVITNPTTLATETTQAIIQPAIQPSDSTWPALRKGVFSGCRFFIHGFPEPKERILLDFLTSHGGQISLSLEDVASSNHAESSSHRYLLVPQLSQPGSHPKLPDGVHIITEFFIERCIHNKTLYSPSDHVWGQPFPQFPIDGFQELTICTAGFINEQLNQIEKTVTQLGANYSEKLNRQISLLVCPDLGALREQKRDLAILHRIPIISVEWLWQCITSGCLVPWDEYQFEELLRNMDTIRARLERREENKKKGRDSLSRSRSEPVITKPAVARPNPRVQAPPSRAGIDTTAFDSGMAGVDHRTPSLARQDTHESHYETAPTHPHIGDAFATAPLSETKASNLNKSASPPKQPKDDKAQQRFPNEGEVGDSEAGEDSDATSRATSKQPPSAPDAEAERQRKVQQAKDLERIELSKRLTTLMGSDDKAPEKKTTLLQSGLPGGPRRRTRQILGRATSNVSVASSASADSATVSVQRQHQDSAQSAGSGGSEFDKFLESTTGIAEGSEEYLPPSTQLEYDNPEARRKRNLVMERLASMGDEKGKAVKSEKEGRDGNEKGSGISSMKNSSRVRDIDPVRRSTRRGGR
ncbi:hypothetical protein F5B22DRAFT_657640 [Xylaria bambusicola]|uniref:uncharacterized protein n=1 Tax=Xylaria bambusicola TaxID=326684 RepID=UPI002007472A|nr:uncharacterized protein F5B22DRAFT_657640 [Xylaria bambusicola]KAI0512797.1 hypothetical protein F5B22DRAFT_657640 [Xylaria bambusicola]